MDTTNETVADVKAAVMEPEVICVEVMEEKELLIIAEQNALAESASQSLLAAFSPMARDARALCKQAEGVTDPKLARAFRLKLREVRVTIESKRKTLKEDYLRTGKAIDGMANILKFIIEPVEETLLGHEQAAERAEAARKATLQSERARLLAEFEADVAFVDLGSISEEQFLSLAAGYKATFEAKKEAARKAEADRIAREQAEAAERERIRLENERLKREAAEQAKAQEAERAKAAEAAAKAKAEREAVEAQAAAERKKAAAEAQAAADKARKEREALEAAALAERQKAEADARAAAEVARKEREAVEAKAKAEREAGELALRKEREARERAEAEALAAKKAEAKRIEEEQEKARKAARAPDGAKVKAFAKSVRSLALPDVSTAEGKAAIAEIVAQIEKFAAWIEKKGGDL